MLSVLGNLKLTYFSDISCFLCAYHFPFLSTVIKLFLQIIEKLTLNGWGKPNRWETWFSSRCKPCQAFPVLVIYIYNLVYPNVWQSLESVFVSVVFFFFFKANCSIPVVIYYSVWHVWERKEKYEIVLWGLGWGSMRVRCANEIALKVDLPYLTPETFCSKNNFINLTNKCIFASSK